MKRPIYLFIAVVIYVGLSFLPGKGVISLPVEILCTFLHEFGHAFFALLTGGSVHSLQVNSDGSGLTTTSGGNNALITMGGYIGSAIFGNVLLRLATASRAKISMIVLGGIMLLSSVFWFDNLATTMYLIGFACFLFLLSRTPANEVIVAFLGVASLIYIVQDFNVGPSSDLKAYESEVGFFPSSVWMYIWLGIVLVITFFNVVHLLKNDRSS